MNLLLLLQLIFLFIKVLFEVMDDFDVRGGFFQSRESLNHDYKEANAF